MSAAEQLQVRVPVGYLNAEDPDVLAALRLHPELDTVLTEGRAKVTEYFGPEAQVELRVAFFPGGWGLYAVVFREGDRSEAMLTALERFERGWALGNDELMRSPMTFTIGCDS